MIYFIFWVVFLLMAVGALLFAMVREKKAQQGVAYGGAYDADEAAAEDGVASLDAGDDGDLQPLDDNQDGFGAAEAVDDFGAEPVGGGDDFGAADFGGGDLGADDFSAFDEEIK